MARRTTLVYAALAVTDTLLAATGRDWQRWLTKLLASDTLLALEKFGGLHMPAHEGLVMATYTSAQALLASCEAVA